MHLLIVHQNFVDHQHPGGTRHLELAKHLVRHGHQCTIVAGSVDFLTGRPLSRETFEIDGVKIRRAYAFPTLHHSYLGRVLSYLCFMLTSIWESLRAGKIDVVLGTSPPIFQLPSAWLVAVIRKRPFLLEVRDLWPAFAIEAGVVKNRFLIWMAEHVEQFFYRRADWVVANSPGFREHLLERGVATNRLTIIPNGVETAMFDPNLDGRAFREELGLADHFVVTYAGALGRSNDLDTIVNAAKLLRDHTDIKILLVGGGKERPQLEKQLQEHQLENVVLGGYFPKARMAEVLAGSHVCLATLLNLEMYRTTYPNKVFDYMAAARPTVIAIDGVIREVIETAEAGTFVTPGDARALADAILRYHGDPDLARQHGQAGRAYAERHFERSDQAEALKSVMERIAVTPQRTTFYRRYLKRPFDLGASLLLLTIFSPVILATAILIRWRLGSPIVFSQIRAGRDGNSFTILKFRTMLDAEDEAGNPLPDEKRLTRFGKFLRACSLDELPQLFNIVRGDMSLIGPRPLLTQYLPRYSPEQARRHDVRPGITGWAQINGRNAIRWEEKFRFDVWYVDHCSFGLDLYILARTVVCVLFRQGISSDGHATMPEFMGTEAAREPAETSQS